MKIIFLFIVLFEFSLSVSPKPYLYTPQNSNLRTDKVSTIDIDSKGKIWIASDEGLIYNYFGTFFTINSNNSNDMIFSDVVTLEVDYEDNLWISFNQRNKIAKYNGSNFEHYEITNSIPVHFTIWNILVDSRNNPWFETRYYYTYFDGLDWISIRPGKHLDPELGQTRGMALDKDENLWFATTKDSIFKFENESLTTLDLSSIDIQNEKVIDRLFIDRNNNLWFSNDNLKSFELFQYNINTKKWNKYDSTNSPIRDYISKIKDDINGHIWVITNRIIYKYDFVEWQTFDYEDYIINHPFANSSEGFSFIDLTFDKENRLWVTTKGAGVFVLSDIISSVEDEKVIENEITLFPNPSENYIKIENSRQIIISKYEIIDITGKTVQNGLYSSNQIYISNLSNGVYFIKLYTDNTFIQKKFVVN
jgi:ligand-binding sensor domain-containing protein